MGYRCLGQLTWLYTVLIFWLITPHLLSSTCFGVSVSFLGSGHAVARNSWLRRRHFVGHSRGQCEKLGATSGCPRSISSTMNSPDGDRETILSALEEELEARFERDIVDEAYRRQHLTLDAYLRNLHALASAHSRHSSIEISQFFDMLADAFYESQSPRCGECGLEYRVEQHKPCTCAPAQGWVMFENVIRRQACDLQQMEADDAYRLPNPLGDALVAPSGESWSNRDLCGFLDAAASGWLCPSRSCVDEKGGWIQMARTADTIDRLGGKIPWEAFADFLSTGQTRE